MTAHDTSHPQRVMTDHAGSQPTRPPRRGALGVLFRQWPLLLVLFGGSFGLLMVALDGFRIGCAMLGISVLVAAAARAVLPARRVGLLVVRSRTFDVSVLVVMGVALVVLAVVVPGPRT
jgi:hypothetical protein